MDFDSILSQWENRRDEEREAPGTKDPEPGSEAPLEEPRGVPGWLERYPPKQKDAEDKTARLPPESEGRSVWLRRDPQDVLDLHGQTGREARDELSRFIRSMRRKGLRKALVVHGKGLHSPEGSVLGPVVREFLESSPEVGDFGRAGRKDGGSGATWFLLRHRSR